MSNYYILKDKSEQDKLIYWWRQLEKNRGDRAILRRAASADEIMLTPAFACFLDIMRDHERWGSSKHVFDSAMIVGLLARVKENDTDKDSSFAKALAQKKKGGNKATMSELRFLQLQKSHDPDEFFLRVSRAIALLGGKVNILSLTDGVLHWLQEHRRVIDREPGKRLAVRWATDYYTTYKD